MLSALSKVPLGDRMKILMAECNPEPSYDFLKNIYKTFIQHLYMYDHPLSLEISVNM